MEPIVHILHLDDDPLDAELIEMTLAEAKDRLPARITHVPTRKEFLAALKDDAIDVILSDWRMPGYDGHAALRDAVALCPDIPFIMVTGELGEDRAIETLKLGAADYVLKDNLKRLVPSIRRALKDASLERERRQSEARYRTLVETSTDGIFIQQGGFIRYVNPAGVVLLGAKASDELIGKPILDIFHPDCHELVKRRAREMKRTGAPAPLVEEKVIRLDGSTIEVETMAAPITYEGAFALQVVLRDITGRRRVEMALRKSEARYRTLFENMTEEVHLWQLVRNEKGEIITWRLVEVNPPTLRSWGKRLEDIKGKTADEIFGPGATEHSMPDIQKVISNGTPYTFEDYIPNLDKYFRFTTIPFGEYFIITGADITAAKQAQRLAEEERAELEAIYRTAPVGLCVLDKNLRWVRINDKLAEVNGFPPEDHIGKTPWELLPDFGGQAEAAMKKVLATGEPLLNVEFTGTTPSQPGVVRSFNERWLPWKDKQGNIIGISVAAEETTEWKRLEAALKESEARFRILADNIPQLVWMADQAGSVFWYNKRWYDYTGADFEEIRGWGWQKLHHPEHVQRVAEHWRQSIENGHGWEETFPLRSKEGDYRWFLSRAFAIKDERGKVVRWFGTNTDITEQLQAAEALRESEKKYRDLFESMTEGFVLVEPVFDMEGRPMSIRCLEVNPAFERLVHRKRAELVGKTVHKLVPAPNEHVMEAAIRIAQSGGAERIEIYSHGLGKWFRAYIFAPEPGRAAFIVADITERKQADEALRRLNEELEERVKVRTEQLERLNSELESFSYTISHDLRAPLRTIGGYAGILSHRLGGRQMAEEIATPLREIRAGVKRMDQLTNALLDFSRLTGKPLNKVPVNMQGLVDRIVEEQRRSEGPTRNVEVIIGYLPGVVADPVLLRQALANLVSNAFKYTRRVAHPRIEINGSSLGKGYRFMIRDNGIGFPATHSSKLFQVFQRLHSQTEFEGTGIGLANVRKIIERHGGDVWAEGEEGKGATFYFTLPGIAATETVRPAVEL